MNFQGKERTVHNMCNNSSVAYLAQFQLLLYLLLKLNHEEERTERMYYV